VTGHELDSDVVESPQLDAERTQHRKVPVRTCVGCRKRALHSALLRVIAVDGRLVVDTHRRLPGRGAWLHPRLECLASAERKKAFPRALRVSGVLDALSVRSFLENNALDAPNTENSSVLKETKEAGRPVMSQP
jgi:hypothetical protein